MREQGSVAALAHHDPGKLQEAFAEAAQRPADVDPGAMRGWKEDD